MKKIIVALLAITMVFAFTSCDNDPALKEMTVGVRLGKHVKGESEDGDNWKFAALSMDGDVVTIQADLASMTPYNSTAGQGEAIWLALLIDTGISDLANVVYDGKALEDAGANEYKDLKGVDGTEGKASEMVLWIKADDAATYENGREIKLSYDGYVEKKITIKVVNDTVSSFVSDKADFDVAFNDATDGATIILTQSIPDGDGVIFPVGKFANKGITIDLNGFTYSAKQNPAGSTDTKSQAFQILRGNKVTFKNGTLDIAEDATPDTFKMVIQNYSDITLDNVTVDGTNIVKSNDAEYTVSNNFGDSIYKNNTKIIAAGDGDFAFDVYYWPANGYGDGVTVTIEDDSVEIAGKVQYAHDNQGKTDFMAKTALVVPSGYETKLGLDVTDYKTSYDFTWVDVEDKAGYKKVALVENNEV